MSTTAEDLRTAADVLQSNANFARSELFVEDRYFNATATQLRRLADIQEAKEAAKEAEKAAREQAVRDLAQILQDARQHSGSGLFQAKRVDFLEPRLKGYRIHEAEYLLDRFDITPKAS